MHHEALEHGIMGGTVALDIFPGAAAGTAAPSLLLSGDAESASPPASARPQVQVRSAHPHLPPLRLP